MQRISLRQCQHVLFVAIHSPVAEPRKFLQQHAPILGAVHLTDHDRPVFRKNVL